VKKYDGDKRADNMQGKIEFKDVVFKYPANQDVITLKDVSFAVDPGDCLAIVGETGSGKSTIIQLIEGFYFCNSGAVLIDDVNIHDYDFGSLRENISLVSQEPILFNGSIKENIRMGKLNASDSEIEAAAKEAEAEEFILKLPDKYETWVGPKGSQVSGGQKQRIAIARAIIKKPKILLLDEATSALDMQTEKKIQLTLDKVMLSRTTIIVAQRLSTIKCAKHILVLDQGKVAETGTYESLMESEGLFSRLINIQKKVSDSTFATASTKKGETLSASQEEKGSELVKKSDKETISRILLLLKQYWGWMVIVLVAALVSGLTFPIFGYLFADSLTTLMGLEDDKIINETRENMYYMFIEGVVIVAGLTLLSGSLARVAALYTYDLRYQSLNSLLYYDQKFYDKPEASAANLAYNLGSDCVKVSNIGGMVLALQLLLVSSLFLGIGVGLTIDVPVTLAVSAFLPLLMYSNIRMIKIFMTGYAQHNLEPTTTIASDALTNIKTVHSFNRQKFFQDKYENATRRENTTVNETAKSNGFMFGFAYCISYFMWGTVGWFGAYRVKENDLDSDDMLSLYFIVVYSTLGFMVVAVMAPDLEGGIESAKKIFAIIDYKPDINAKSAEGTTSEIQGHFLFQNVAFRYESREVVVLKGVTFTVPAGTTLGITGTTGSGKSTIAQLLLRFYDPTSGQISLDGVPLVNYNVKFLREHVCWVGQEPILFKGGLFFNLQLARQNVTQEEAIEALRKAQAADIVEKYGLDNDVGLRGSRLSGGQKQRVAIARALVRRPKVLVLDESTSALDSITESNLQKEIMREKFTIIAIAHRLSTIKEFSQIILIEQGAVAETGDHESLMNIPNGLYKKLYETSD
jgi:ATP-binding cassette, subfamily B (MDR/TAP), member 1